MQGNMTTKTKALIIDGALVPATEAAVLKALVELDKAVTVPELARVMNQKISDASLYTLLKRLAEQRGLVSRKETRIDVQGTQLRRVVWQPMAASVSYFQPSRKDEKYGSKETQQYGGELQTAG